MEELFARALSQGLQAFMPAAVAAVWLRRSGRIATLSSVRLGLLAAVPLTAIGGWLFLSSAYQARWESLMAVAGAGLALAFGAIVWRGLPCIDAPSGRRVPTRWRIAIAGAAALIVVRQTMLLAATFGAATIQARSLDATEAIVGAVALALAAAAGWILLGRRLPQPDVIDATKAFAGLFLAQVALYAIHRSAEARFLPWSAVLDPATEPYGPDGVWGRDVSYLLFALPIMSAVSTALYRKAGRWPSTMARVKRAGLAGSGMIVAGGIVLAGARVGGFIPPGVGEAGFAEPPVAFSSILESPHLVFLSKAADSNDGTLSVAPLQAGTAVRASAALRCERVSFAAGRGICLQAERGLFTSYRAILLDGRLQPGASFKLEGRPSRTRVSPDGRVGAITMFVAGHSYAMSSFSTKTILLDMASGDVLGDLEQFTTWRDGRRFSAPDFNFWGVTFARDSNTFYATLRTIGDVPSPSGQVTRRAQTFLVRGDLGLRKLTVLRENVECPSLSPDNRLIAFKKSVGAGTWRFDVLDLATMKERPIAAETRSVDDQIEWLDNSHVLYGTFRSANSAIVDVYVAPVDGSGPARVFVAAAESPIVVR